MDMTYFNAEKTRDGLVDWIKDWFDKNGKNSQAVIGISGGKDSTIVAGLCVRALGKDRVFGVLMPNGDQADINDSVRVCEALGIRNVTVNIKDTYYTLKYEIATTLGLDELSEQSLINLSPRLRMTTLYAVSQTIGGRVVNTSNKSEWTIGYFTKAGDEIGDLKPLINLTKSEVVEIGKTMHEIPIDLIVKQPADGLTGKSDEDKIGFLYADLDECIRGNIDSVPRETRSKIANRIHMTDFKRKPVAEFNPDNG